MRLAALNTNDIAQLLGIRINKVRVNKQDGYIEIKPNGWLDKREWREINEILTQNGNHVVLIVAGLKLKTGKNVKPKKHSKATFNQYVILWR